MSRLRRRLARLVRTPPLPPAERPASWAQPVALPGVPNLHRVAAHLWRSAQPTAEGLRALEARGVRRIVSLRAFHSDRRHLRGTDLTGERHRLRTWRIRDHDVVAVVRQLRDASSPVLVHCLHGADRTGVMCAVYRMAVEGWPRTEALREFLHGGFGFHPLWGNIVRYLEQVDPGALRAALDAPA